MEPAIFDTPTFWQLTRAMTRDHEMVDTLLRKGWEPFASEPYRMWFRRPAARADDAAYISADEAARD